ncbi:hypothetical protein PR048_001046 [Dryococelus australis]|uniref:Uncharacterized protein n=1 Tax=Dryococelus australis TaxID=614101 RepID=A0ABQ9IGE3_9NEOP|nr:hypothetical protein PR048_001046 [Dryococelus australis]
MEQRWNSRLGGKRKFQRKPVDQRASTGTIPTCESLGATPPGIEPIRLCRRLAAVAERLAWSSPTKATRAQSPAGSAGFRMWESCRTMPLVGGSSQRSAVSPALSFRRRPILTSITLIGSQDHAVKSRPNLFTHSCPRVHEGCMTPTREAVFEATSHLRGLSYLVVKTHPRENPPTNGIVRHDSHTRKS